MRNRDTSKATASRLRPVSMMDGKGVVTFFKSIKEASDKTGIAQSHICLNCQGKARWAGGYQFRYLEK